MVRTITITLEPRIEYGEYLGTACTGVQVHDDTFERDLFSADEITAAISAARNAPQVDPVDWPGLGRIRVVSRKAVKDFSRGTPSLVTITVAE